MSAIRSHTAECCNAQTQFPYIGLDFPQPTLAACPLAPLARRTAMAKKLQQKHPKTVATLEKNDCRWPIGDPREADFHFCGAHQVPGRPYCELHWRMAFQPARSRHGQSPPVLAHLRAA
jgi:hypothetical protein